MLRRLPATSALQKELAVKVMIPIGVFTQLLLVENNDLSCAPRHPRHPSAGCGMAYAFGRCLVVQYKSLQQNQTKGDFLPDPNHQRTTMFRRPLSACGSYLHSAGQDGALSFRYFSSTCRLATTKRSHLRVVKTLDPLKFKEMGQCALNLQTLRGSGPTVKVELGGGMRSTRISYYNSPGKEDNALCRPGFPSYSTGYLYFRPAELNKPPISAEIRFRLAATLEDFSAGEDLKVPNGGVWRRPIFSLARAVSCRSLYDKVVEENLIPHELQREINVIGSKDINNRSAAYRPDSTFLYTLSDPFILDISLAHKSISAVTPGGILSASWQTPFSDRRNSSYFSPYHGTLRVRFEPSTLPEHAGTRTIVIRVLDILSPIQPIDPSYDLHVPLPQKGSLIFNSLAKPVSYDLDLPRTAGDLVSLFQLLWVEGVEKHVSAIE